MMIRTSIREVQAREKRPSVASPQRYPPGSTKSPVDPRPRSMSAKRPQANPPGDRDLRCIPAAAAASVNLHPSPQFGPSPHGIGTFREVFHDHRHDRATTNDPSRRLAGASTTCWNPRWHPVASTTSTRALVRAPVPQSTINTKSMKSTTSTRRRRPRPAAVSTIARGSGIESTRVVSTRRLAQSMRRFPTVGGTDHHPLLDPVGTAIGMPPPAAVAAAAPSIKSTSTRSSSSSSSVVSTTVLFFVVWINRIALS